MSVPWFIPPQQSGLSALADGFGQGFASGRKRYEDNVAGQAFADTYDRAPAPQTTLGALGQMVGGGGGFGSITPAAPTSPRAAAVVPQGERASYIRQGLVQRGLPEHVADAFVINFQDESGLNPDINEANPIVPGSRGGYGLYQLTGPRRRMYEAFARDRGVDTSDIDAQLDFLKFELGGPEARAAQSILGSKDTASAAQAIVNNFLRPAESHRSSRAARYAGLGGGVQVASADGSGPSPETMNALMSGVNESRASRGEPALSMAQEPSMPSYQSPDIGSLISGIAAGQTQASNVTGEQLRLMLRSEETRPMAMALWQAKVEGDPRAAERALGLALDLENQNYGRYRDQVGDAQRAEGIRYERGRDARQDALVADNLRYERGRDAIADQRYEREFARESQPQPGFRQATTEEAARYGSAAGQFGPDGRFYAVNPPSGMSVEVGADGVTRVMQGPGAGRGSPLTEGQSKDAVFSTRAEGALPLIDQYEGALTSRSDAYLGMVPGGFGRDYQNTDFQLAQQAGDEFLQAILRKDTGAAITEQEQALYGNTYLPRPGDSPELIAQKRQSRARAAAAIEAGMPPAAIVQRELALRNSSAVPEPVTAGPQVGTPENPIQLGTVTVPTGVDPALWDIMTPEEKSLWQN